MKTAVFSTKAYDKQYLQKAAERKCDLSFFDTRLTLQTASLASGFEAICVFVNDQLDKPTLHLLSQQGVRYVALRCAGFNNVDLNVAAQLEMQVARVPDYSPHAVADHTVALILSLNRKVHLAFQRVRDGNFALDGLLGFDLHGKTLGVVGYGKIGRQFVRRMLGFGCHVLVFDPILDDSPKIGSVDLVDLPTLYARSDIISLHCPLTPETLHLINQAAIEQMKPDVMLVNTSRGAVIDSAAIVRALKTQRIGGLAIDVYEEEADLFFEDLSNKVISDDTFTRLLTFPNVLITGHQGFFTHEALTQIANTTIANLLAFETGQPCENLVTATAS